jgi:hypothetical protein
VTAIAIFGNHSTAGSFVLSIVAPEAPRTRKMTDVVRIRFPVDIHFGKEIPSVPLLEFRRRGGYKAFLFVCDFWISLIVVVLHHGWDTI